MGLEQTLKVSYGASQPTICGPPSWRLKFPSCDVLMSLIRTPISVGDAEAQAGPGPSKQGKAKHLPVTGRTQRTLNVQPETKFPLLG